MQQIAFVMTYEYDYLVIGSGIAGMSFALKVAAAGGRVALVCKTTLDEANTALAQGGVASVMRNDGRSPGWKSAVGWNWMNSMSATVPLAR